MAYYRIRYRVPYAQSESLSLALQQHAALAVSIEDAGGTPHYDHSGTSDPQWQQVYVTGLFGDSVDPSSLHRDLCSDDNGKIAHECEPEVEAVPEQDWERACIDQFKPLQLAPALWVCPSRTTPPDPRATNLILDPGRAFGTGSHATTALCLNWLATAELAGKAVLDYGCGSGILAVAALKLGAARVIAVDTDPRALGATRDNARRNQVDDARLQILDPKQLPENTRADVTLANILAGTLVELAPVLTRTLAANGTILLSGILESQMDKVQSAFDPAFSFAATQRDEWCLLVGRRHLQERHPGAR